jgi:hypothetical protein
MPELTQERLKELLHYNPETGIFMRVKGVQGAAKGAIVGSPDKEGYLRVGIDYITHKLHRLAVLYMEGEFPANDMDHINHVRDDNRWKNLRAATKAENAMNISLSPRNTSGFCGVAWDKKGCRWAARITAAGKTMHLGNFLEIEDAIDARKAANIKYGFHENHGKSLPQRK